MIDKISHYSLLAHVTVHDEEALTSLELNGRTAAKVNEIVDDVNAQRDQMEKGIAGIPGKIKDHVSKMEKNGELSDLINDTLFRDVGGRVDALDNRVNSIIASGTPTEGNTELIDARSSKAGKNYATLGAHIRAIESGEALADALKPGTIRHGRISAGMLMGELGSRYVIGEQWTTAGKWNSSGYVDAKTLEIVSHTGYRYSEPMPCEYGDTFRVYTAIYGNLIPVAIFYDRDKNIIGTSGDGIGTGNWNFTYHYVQVDKAASYISFQCGSAYLTDFRVLRYSPRMYPDPIEAMGGRGYIRCNAYNRTDTITDRAQVKMWFPVQEGETYRFRVEPLVISNVSGWTVRFFAASDNESYTLNLPVSDTGRSYAASLAIATDLTIPTHSEEEQPFKYLCVFVDFIAANPRNKINATIAYPTLRRWDGEKFAANHAEPENIMLHGDIGADCIGVVPAGAMRSPLWRKKIEIVGDSLASGNTLNKRFSWFNLACSRYDMDYYNGAVNGEPVTAMGDYADDYSNDLDYFVIQGGANDKRLNKTIADFRAAIQKIVANVRKASPRCKILLMTNWRRTNTANALGLYDSDYVSAMLETGEELNIPVVNNYANSLNLMDSTTMTWADEGYVSTGEANIHFSKAANKWLADSFIKALEGI